VTGAYTITSGAAEVEGLNISALDSSATVVPGGSVAMGFAVSPVSPATTFQAAVNMSVSGLPAGATYNFSPATLAAGTGASNVTLTAQLPQTAAATHPDGGIDGKFLSHMTPFALSLLLLPFARRLRRASKRLSRSVTALLLAAAAMATVIGLGGCGAYSGELGQTYTVTVTGSTGAVSKSTTVSLTVN
jgi:hypothetical protein